MNDEIQILEEREVLGKTFRVFGTIDHPLFLARDVAKWIEHSNPTEMLRGIDESEKLISTIFSGGQKREMSFLTEDGLYEILMQSRKPIAKEFKRKVKEILKEIRQTGAYMTEETLEKVLTNPDLLIGLAQQLKEYKTKVRQQQAKIEADRPKVVFADAVSAARTSILVGELAKLLRQNGIDMGQNRLFQWLRENGYLMKTGSSSNLPTQASMERGLFEIKETSISHSDGHITIQRTPKVTGRGQQYFINLFMPLNEHSGSKIS